MKPGDITGKYDLVFWDFDGVIMDSMPVRDLGFVEVLKHYPAEQVDQLLDYHRKNGGLSRYHKFKYFYETIRGEECTDKMVADLSASFSVIMKQLLVNKELLITETVDFIKQLQGKVSQIVVSGSDQTELRYL
ncbi:MAG: HAD family hydrolase, partial [Sphingobacteriales bacterium]